MKKLSFVLLLLLFSASYILSQSDSSIPPLAKTVAENYGIDSWANVKSIDFTFNVKNDKVHAVRSWKWQPQKSVVQFSGADQNGKDTVITYNRKDLNSKDSYLTYVDKRFINDSYWLLFPFHLIWDKNVVITDQGTREFPISHKNGRSLQVRYTNNIGYTPNDVFILFLDNHNMIKEWIYRPGGNKEKQRIYTWQDDKNFGGITISTTHNGSDGKTKVWFTNLAISE